jgi:hypothetical protein
LCILTFVIVVVGWGTATGVLSRLERPRPSLRGLVSTMADVVGVEPRRVASVLMVQSFRGSRGGVAPLRDRITKVFHVEHGCAK